MRKKQQTLYYINEQVLQCLKLEKPVMSGMIGTGMAPNVQSGDLLASDISFLSSSYF